MKLANEVNDLFEAGKQANLIMQTSQSDSEYDSIMIEVEKEDGTTDLIDFKAQDAKKSDLVKAAKELGANLNKVNSTSQNKHGSSKSYKVDFNKANDFIKKHKLKRS